MTDDASPEDQDDRKRATRAVVKGREKLREIQNMFASFSHEVKGDRFWRYQRNVSPGLQEYIEALSFTHYLDTGRLVSYDEVQKSLSDSEGTQVGSRNPLALLLHSCIHQYFPLPLEDYLLGLSDLTGELMRFAISSIPHRGGRAKANEVCAFVRNCKAGMHTTSVFVHSG